MVAQLVKLLKGAGKIAKQLRSCEQIVAKNGQALTKGQKTVNSCFKALDKSFMPLLITTGVGTIASIFSVGYAVKTDNEKLAEPSFFATCKGFDTFLGTALGFLAGGPIGAWIGAGLAYSTDYSILGSLLAISEDFTIEDCHTGVAESRQITYDSVKELLGFNKSEEVTTTTEDKTRQPETAPQKTDNKIKFKNKDTNEEIEYEFGWIHPDKNMTLTNSKGETFNLEKGITYYVEQDGTIKECIDSSYLTPNGNWFGGSVVINESHRLEIDQTIKTANGQIYELKEGTEIIYKKDGSLEIVYDFEYDDKAGQIGGRSCLVGKIYTASEDCKIGDLEVKKGDKYYCRVDGTIELVKAGQDENMATFKLDGQNVEVAYKKGFDFIAEKDMKLTDRFGIKYELEAGDIYTCQDNGTMTFKYGGNIYNTAKEDFSFPHKLGEVLVKKGNRFISNDSGSITIVPVNDEIMKNFDGENFEVKAGDDVNFHKDGTISICKAMTTLEDGVYHLSVGDENVADRAITITDHNDTVHTINEGDKYICDENGVITVIPKGSQISFRRIGSGAQPLELGVGEQYIAGEDMKFLVGKKNNLVSVNQGDTLVCKPDSTLDVRRFVPQVQKVSIRKIGTPTPVEYEVGKTYTADKDTRFLVGQNNSLITVKAGQNFKVNADKTVEIID